MQKWIKQLVCSALAMMALAVQGASARQEICMNADWKFKPGKTNIDQPINDAEWQTVQVPHDAGVYGEFSRKNSDSAQGWLPRGKGTYRSEGNEGVSEGVSPIY